MSTGESANGEKTSNEINWTIGSKIRDGRHGPVYLGLRMDTGDLISAEELAHQDDPGAASVLEHVVATLESRLTSPNMPNVISYLGCQLKEGRIFVLTEYLPGGTLRDLIRNYGAVPQPLARSILRQAVLGLQQLHEQGIAPMFLELDNVLMDNVGSVKVEAPLLDAATTGTGKALLPTTLAPPPELLLGQQDVRKADVWLLGVMAAQLLTGDCSLADGTSDGPVATRTKEAQGSSALGLLIPGRVAGRFDGRASDLIRQCLCMDTNHRPSVSDLLEHPFLNGSD